MNKSKEFVLSLIRSGRLSGFPEEKAMKADTYNPLRVSNFSEVCNRTYELKHSDNKYTLVVTIKYDPDADFDYCTTNYQMNDGTTMFQLQAFGDILKKICRVETCYTPKFPEGGLKGDYKITYIVGDFVYIGYADDDNAPEDKKWMCWNQKTALPIKFDVEKL